MNVLQATALMIFGCMFGAALGGYILLRAYEEFRKALVKGSRFRLWYSFFLIVFTFLALCIGFSGMNRRGWEVKPLRIPVTMKCNEA